MICPNIFGHCTYFFVRNGVIYTVFFANCSPCFEKTIWPTINLIQLNDAKFITLLVCQTDKDKKREKSKYISNLAELKKKYNITHSTHLF